MQHYNRCLNMTTTQQTHNGQNMVNDQQHHGGDHQQHHHQQQPPTKRETMLTHENGRHHMNSIGNCSAIQASSASVATTATTSLEPCKQHAIAGNANDRSPLKVTTATN